MCLALVKMGSFHEQEILQKIIQLYSGMTHLWKKDHGNYHNKRKRNESFDVLLKIYKQFDKYATDKVLRKKIENMRTCYTKELKKVVASQLAVAAGGGNNKVYVPTLWYFDAFSFLESQTDTSRIVADASRVVTDTENENLSSDGDQNDLIEEDIAYDDSSIQYLEDTTITSPAEFCSISRKKKKNENLIENEITFNDSSTNYLGAATSCSHSKKRKTNKNLLEEELNLIRSAENVISHKDDDSDVFGRHVGLQMKDLDKRQKIIAQKIISDVIFNAKLERLSEHSCVVLKPHAHNSQNAFDSPEPPIH